MILHIYYLVHDEHRPFSYLDFMRFEVDGQEYKMTHGTFRNNISCLIKEGLVEVSYKSDITFYTLGGIKFDKASRISMTRNHAGVPCSSASVSSPLSAATAAASPSTLSLSSNPLYRIIRNLPLNKNSVHDIHLRFSCPQIYELTSSSISTEAFCYDCAVNSRSKDILLRAWKSNGLLTKVSIHRTDTVSAVIGCSLNPIPLDIKGVIRLTNLLAVVEDRLSRIAEGSHAYKNTVVTGGTDSSGDLHRHGHECKIPSYSQWIVTLWHFGADALVEYSGEKFSTTWEIAENVLVKAYSKTMIDNRARFRLERQEYPWINLADAIAQKIDGNWGVSRLAL
jgi:hypothetical protein